MIIYSLQVGFILAICLVFYKLFLQKETFFQLNRFILLSCLVLAFILPVIPVSEKFSFSPVHEFSAWLAENGPTTGNPKNDLVVEKISSNDQLDSPQNAAEMKSANEVTFANKMLKWALWIYWCGVAILGANLLFQLAVLFWQARNKPIIKDGMFCIVELDDDQSPCSFGNMIFINPSKYEWETYNQILTHEKVHVKQAHTLDLMVAETVLVFQWFNPFAWLYRKELENNLEFLTDDAVVNHHSVNAADYQMSLLQVSVPNFSMKITTNYNQSLLKRRMLMMNAKKSNVHIMWKYFMIGPLLVVLVCGLNKPKVNATETAHTGVLQEIETTGQAKGLWAGTIKGENVKIECKSDDDRQNKNYSYVMPGRGTFDIKEFTNLPRTASADFAVSREAGTAIFNGKFDDNQGFGKYKFKVHESYKSFIEFKNIRDMDEDDYFSFFILDVRKSYIQLLNDNGYRDLTKSQVLALTTQQVDAAYLNFWQRNGFDELSVAELIALKKLKVDSVDLAQIRNAGYGNISATQLIKFKSQPTPKNISALRNN